MRHIRDILIAFAWCLILYAALDAYRKADHTEHNLTELALLAWLITVIVGGLVMAVAYVRIVRRFESDHCPACGYDLRATRDRCPECGFEVTCSETTLPRWLHGSALDMARQQQMRGDSYKREPAHSEQSQS